MDINSKLSITRFEIERQLNHVLGSINVKNLSSDARLNLTNLKIELGKVILEINKFREDSNKQTEKPEDFDRVKAISECENATDEDKNRYKELEEEFNKKWSELLIPFYNEVIDIPCTFIKKPDFDTIVKSNELNTLFDYEYLFNRLVK